MGLLGKASGRIVNVTTTADPRTVIIDFVESFEAKNESFCGVLLSPREDAGESGLLQKIAGMITDLGEVRALSGGKCLVLLPGSMDDGLFAHQLSKSAKVHALCHFHADSASVALKELSHYIE